MPKRKLTKPVKISFMAKAGEQPPLRNLDKMTKPIRISFVVHPKGKKPKRVSFTARR